MEFKVLKLGTVCTDRATELEGTLTHWIMDMSQSVVYLLQPKALDKQGQPVSKVMVDLLRLEVKDSDFETVDVPFEILGTTVEDKASGFKGMATQFVRHINGCFHISIQPKGFLAESGEPVKSNEFDIRGCVGEKIKNLSEKQRKKSEKKEPSPASGNFNRKIPKLS